MGADCRRTVEQARADRLLGVESARRQHPVAVAPAAVARDAARDDGEALEQLGPLLQTLFDGHEALRAAVGAARAAAPAPPPPSLGEVAEEYSESGIALQAYEEF